MSKNIEKRTISPGSHCDNDQDIQQKIIKLYEAIEAKTITNIQWKRQNDCLQAQTQILLETIKKIKQKKVQARRSHRSSGLDCEQKKQSIRTFQNKLMSEQYQPTRIGSSGFIKKRQSSSKVNVEQSSNLYANESVKSIEFMKPQAQKKSNQRGTGIKKIRSQKDAVKNYRENRSIQNNSGLC